MSSKKKELKTCQIECLCCRKCINVFDTGNIMDIVNQAMILGWIYCGSETYLCSTCLEEMGVRDIETGRV